MAKKYRTEDRELIRSLVTKSPSPPDAWPYTEEFEKNRTKFNADKITPWSRPDFWMIVLAVRKQGGARGTARGPKSHTAPQLPAIDRSRLRSLMPKKRGDVDRIPYSSRFETSLAQYNKGATLKLKDYEFWRCLLKIAKTRIRKDARPRMIAAIDAFVEFVNIFNQIRQDRRAEKSLIYLHWAFEHLLKACVIQQGGKIRETENEFVIGFERAKNLGLTDADVKFLTHSDWKYLSWLQNIRGAAYHDLIFTDETELYLIAVTGLKLFDKLLDDLFLESLADHVGPVVLPVSTVPLVDISLLLDRKSTQIYQLIKQGEVERARGAARSLVELENALKRNSPDDALPQDSTKSGIDSVIDASKKRKPLSSILENTAAIRIGNEGGVVISMSLSGSKGTSVSGRKDEGEQTVAYRPVNPADKFTLSHVDLANRLKLSTTVLTGVMRELKIRENKDLCYMHGRHNAVSKQAGFSPQTERVVRNFLEENGDKNPLFWYRKHVNKKNK